MTILYKANYSKVSIYRQYPRELVDYFTKFGYITWKFVRSLQFSWFLADCDKQRSADGKWVMPFYPFLIIWY